MEKDAIEPKTIRTGSGDPPPGYGETELIRGNIGRRFLDSFKRNPNAQITHQPPADGSNVDPEIAAQNTANSPLERRLKGRHMQMIALGGSIGVYIGPVMKSCSHALTVLFPQVPVFLSARETSYLLVVRLPSLLPTG